MNMRQWVICLRPNLNHRSRVGYRPDFPHFGIRDGDASRGPIAAQNGIIGQAIRLAMNHDVAPRIVAARPSTRPIFGLWVI